MIGQLSAVIRGSKNNLVSEQQNIANTIWQNFDSFIPGTPKCNDFGGGFDGGHEPGFPARC